MRMAKHKPANSLLTETPRADTYKAVKKRKTYYFAPRSLLLIARVAVRGTPG
jgi:hypothetical protein